MEQNSQYPEFSGFQIQCEIGPIEKSFKYEFGFIRKGVGFEVFRTGEINHSYAEGEKVWIDVYFEKPVSTTGLKEGAQAINLRSRSVRAKHTLSRNWRYEVENESKEKEYLPKMNYRLLGLVADSGTDFLGNSYRALVSEASF